jgi:ABC-type sugar transport system substrate-binding protein
VVFQNIAEDAYVNLLRELKTQGCILGSYDNPSNIADYSISASNYELGKVIGSMCGEWTHNNPGSKKVALAKFDQMDIMIERARGMRDGFKEKCPEGTIAYDQDININDMGYSFGEALVTSAPDIQSVMAITDGPCISVEQAFAAAGWTWDNHKIGLFGSDASVDGMRELRAGGMFKGTVYMDLVTQVTSLFRRCLNAMETGKVDASQKLVYFTMIPVTLQNADIVK